MISQGFSGNSLAMSVRKDGWYIADKGRGIMDKEVVEVISPTIRSSDYGHVRNCPSDRSNCCLLAWCPAGGMGVSRVHSRHVPAALCSKTSKDTTGLDRKRYQGFSKREAVSALSVLVAQAQRRILGSGAGEEWGAWRELAIILC